MRRRKIVALIGVIHNQVLSLLSHRRPRQRAIHRFKQKQKKFCRYCSVRGSVSGQVAGYHGAKEDTLSSRSLNPAGAAPEKNS